MSDINVSESMLDMLALFGRRDRSGLELGFKTPAYKQKINYKSLLTNNFDKLILKQDG